MNNTKVLGEEGEMEAAIALMQLNLEPPDWSKLTTAQTTPNPTQTENRQSQTDFLNEAPIVPSTSTHAPIRVSLDLKVKVTARNSKYQSSEVSTLHSPTTEVVEVLSGGLIIRNDNNISHNQALPTTPARNGKSSSSNKNNLDELDKLNQTVGNNMGTRRIKHDVGTQTEYYDDPYERLLERINILRATKKELEAELKSLQERTLESTERSNSEGDSNPPSVESGSPRPKYLRHARMPKSDSSSSNTGPSLDSDDDTDYKAEQIFEVDENDDNEEDFAHSANQGANVTMVPLGEGNAKVPLSVLKHMDWSSYTHATRKLLTAVFPRKYEILATHSLSGKPSPAFPGKKAKTQLDPDLVNDIVHTVMDRCDTSEGRIRMSITTKCADESKMYRNRLKNRKRRRLLSKKENFNPLSLPLNLSIKK